MTLRQQLFANNAKTTISQPITPLDTSITLLDASSFPSPSAGQYFLVTLDTGTSVEILECSNRLGNVLTVIRAMEGTVASSFPAGTFIGVRVTSSTLGSFLKNDGVLYNLNSVDLLTSPTTSNSSSYICSTVDDGNNLTVALKATSLTWKFTNYTKTAFSGVVASSTLSSITSSITPTSEIGSVVPGKYLIQFTTGVIAGTVRKLYTRTGNSFTWATNTSVAPTVGDQFEVYQSTVSSISALGDNYVTLITDQNIVGVKTFTSDTTSTGVLLDNGLTDGGKLTLKSLGNTSWQVNNQAGSLRFLYNGTTPFQITGNGGTVFSQTNSTSQSQVSILGQNTTNSSIIYGSSLGTQMTGGNATSSLAGTSISSSFTPSVVGSTLFSLYNTPSINNNNAPVGVHVNYASMIFGAGVTSGTVTVVNNYASAPPTLLGTPTGITVFHNFSASDSSSTLIANAYGFRGLLSPVSGKTRWNLYMDGGAPNHIAGKLLIGSTTDSGVSILQVAGGVSASSVAVAGSISATATTTLNIGSSAGNVLVLDKVTGADIVFKTNGTASGSVTADVSGLNVGGVSAYNALKITNATANTVIVSSTGVAIAGVSSTTGNAVFNTSGGTQLGLRISNYTTGGTAAIYNAANVNNSADYAIASSPTITYINGSTSTNLQANGTTRLVASTTGVSVTGAMDATGSVTLSGNASKFSSTYAGVTTTNVFTDTIGGVISVDGAKSISFRTGGIAGTNRAVVSDTGLAVTGQVSFGESQSTFLSTKFDTSTDGKNIFIGGGGQLVAYDPGVVYSGSYNTFLGKDTGVNTTTGYRNTFVGSLSGQITTTGYENTFIGAETGSVNTSGYQNTAFGYFAGNSINTGFGNTITGAYSGADVTYGTYNTIIGYNNGRGITYGSNNTIIGCQVYVAAALSNNIIIADGAGVIRAQHDNVKWNLSGPVVIGGPLKISGATNGNANESWIGGNGTTLRWFYNVPLGGDHTFGTNNTSIVTINSLGVTVGGHVSPRAATTSTQAVIGSQLFGFRNKIINGGFNVQQRVQSTSLPPSSTYIVDRWRANYVGGTAPTVNCTTVTSPGNSSSGYQLQMIGTFGGTAIYLEQRIEAVNISDMMNTDIIGGIRVYQNSGAAVNMRITLKYADLGVDSYSAPITFAVGSYVSVPSGVYTDVTINANTVAAGISITYGIQFTLEVASIAGPAGTNILFGNASLEVGTLRTPFELRPYGTELLLCQRYYTKLVAGVSSAGFCNVTTMSSTYGYGIGQLPVRMRITPSIITSGSFRVIGGANEAVVIAGNAVYTGPQTYAVQVTATNTFVAAGASLLLQANADAAAFISCSSEL